jgi:cytochrome c biogenesis protein CcdA/thiol-disulfide isomerase/thioredoxin
MSLLLISFIAGILTVLAPCILPLLPIIVGGSLTSNILDKKKVLVVVTSLGLSVLFFTFLLKVSTLFINVPEHFWQWVSGLIIITLGLIHVFPKLWEGDIIASLNIKSNALLGKGELKKSFLGNIIVGVALGPVFSTCSPTYFIILATVLPVSLTVGIIYMVAYIVGLCLALLVIVFLSSKVINKLGLFVDQNGYFKKVLGVIFILVGIFIISGLDKKLQTSILNKGFFDVTKIEQKLLEINNRQETGNMSEVKKEIETIKTDPEKQEVKEKDKIIQAVNSDSKIKTIDNTGLQLAPEISTPDGFINTEGKQVTISELKGKKVVLVSFWTYSCINCKRTLPYLNDWYSKYKDQGLEIISIHTPEFAFERVQKNVEDAVVAQNIKYPVVLDNDYSTWSAYGNQYWPRKYLVNKDGYIIYDHAGEGDYEETERQIKKALEELDTN